MLWLIMSFSLQGHSRSASRRGRKAAVSREQVAEMADEEGARQQQLQKALQLAVRLENALSTCEANDINQIYLLGYVAISVDLATCKAGKQLCMLHLIATARENPSDTLGQAGSSEEGKYFWTVHFYEVKQRGFAHRLSWSSQETHQQWSTLRR